MDSTESYDGETEMESEDGGKSNPPNISSIFHSHCCHCHGTGITEDLGRQISTENIRQKHKIHCNEEGKPILMQRSQVQGTVEENIQQLQHLVATTVPVRKKRFFRTGRL